MNLERELEELKLLKYSLLPGELMIVLDRKWQELLDSDDTPTNDDIPPLQLPPCRIQIRLDSESNPQDHVWFELELALNDIGTRSLLNVLVKGTNLGRTEQQRWKNIVSDLLEQVHDQE